MTVETRTYREDRRDGTLCFLLVFVCFALGSACYIEWLYRLVELAPPTHVDTLTMVVGYLMQALGILGAALVAGRRGSTVRRGALAGAIVLQLAFAIPAAESGTLAGSLAFGYPMNVLVGVIAFAYLDRLARYVGEQRRGTVFGGGYACAVVVNWLLSLGRDAFAAPVMFGIVSCVVLAAAAVVVTFLLPESPAGENGGPLPRDAAPAPTGSAGAGTRGVGGLIALAAITVVLLSLVKNLGFSFPTSDISAGMSFETSRMFYAAGLLVAGIVSDYNRKYGAICCLAALVTPFALLALSGKPLPAMIVWAADYFFYGFFAMYRVVLFADMAPREGLPFIAGFGLLFGRVGDALGTVLCQTFAGNSTTLVIAAAAGFVVTAFAFFRLFQHLYMPQPVIVPAAAPVPDERAIFEEFSALHGLSTREREVLRLVLDDASNADIADELFISKDTAKFHVRNILKKTETKNRTELRAKYNMGH